MKKQKTMYTQMRRDPELSHSFHSNQYSKLSTNMKERPSHKKINSHSPKEVDDLKFNKERAVENAFENNNGHVNNKHITRKSIATPTKQDIQHAKQRSEADEEQKKKELIENLDFDKYKEIETELDVIRDIQQIENNFQNEQRCKILFLRYKIVEFSIALFCIICIFIINLAVSSAVIYHNMKTYDVLDKTLDQNVVNRGIYYSIIMVSISTGIHIILTILRYYLIIEVKKASLEISKIGI